MRPVFTSQSIKHIEQQASQQMQVPMYELMLRAGHESFQRLQQCWPQANKILLITGSGNNAGDGLVLAKQALEAGYQVTIAALKELHQLSGDALLAWRELKAYPHKVIEVRELSAQQPDVIIDAILGTGFKGELRADYRQAIDHINNLSERLSIPVLSLDIASGVYADSAEVADSYIKAQQTISFIFPKLAHVMGDALDASGRVKQVSLGVSQEQFYQQIPRVWQQELVDVIEWIPKRKATCYKNTCGHLLCVGGQQSMGGAIILAAETGLKAGAGLVTCHIATDNRVAALARCPEVMWTDKLPSSLEPFQAMVLGPGLGRMTASGDIVKNYIDAPIKKIIDADGLYWLAQQEITCDLQTTVLTPHIGEAATLLSCDTASIKQDRIAAVKAIAKKYQAVTVLKGAGTLISDGTTTIVAGGAHSAMATAGLGDVLSGLIGSLLAQGLSALEASRLAVSLHFAAAVKAADNRTRGMLATEVSQQINSLINGQY